TGDFSKGIRMAVSGGVGINPLSQYTADGGVISVGASVASGKVTIQRTNAQGTVVWARQVTVPGLQTLGTMLPVPDGSFVITGQSNNNVFIIKTDTAGHTGCTDSLVTVGNEMP